MSHSELTQFFRNPVTGQSKEVFAFVVDNGPSEAPANLQVQMLLVRLMKFLNLDKATQRSFAEYLSKRNLWREYMLSRIEPCQNMECLTLTKFTNTQKLVHLNTRRTWRPWPKILLPV